MVGWEGPGRLTAVSTSSHCAMHGLAGLGAGSVYSESASLAFFGFLAAFMVGRCKMC